ncbi:MAG: hypothetical protein QM733_09325 [Ilumatobacteraceae bacterium]
MHVVARVRLFLVRHPWVWWAAIAVVAIVVGVSVGGAVRRLDEERRSWGEPRQVWVAMADTAPGEPIVADARTYPVSMVPAGALDAPPAGAARQRIAAGEVIVADDVTTTGTPGLIPPGWVAVPVAQRSPVAHVGDEVAAFADGRHLADGVVVAVDADQVVVAIPAESAPAVTQAVPGGAVVVGLVGPPDGT